MGQHADKKTAPGEPRCDELAVVKRAGKGHPTVLRICKNGIHTFYVDPEGQKRLWAGLRKHRPKLADLLENEPMSVGVRTIFNANPMFTIGDIKLFMEQKS